MRTASTACCIASASPRRRIANKADKSQDKVKALGEALTEAGEDQPDEEEDAEAAGAPKRARKK